MSCVRLLSGHRWSIGAWSDCSVTCSGGVRMRTVMCLRKVGHRKSEVVKHTQCDGKRPKSRMRCNTKRCPTHWATDAWSNVSQLSFEEWLMAWKLCCWQNRTISTMVIKQFSHTPHNTNLIHIIIIIIISSSSPLLSPSSSSLTTSPLL